MEVRAPQNQQEWDAYYDLRYRILRKPWDQARGSEKDNHEESSKHFALWDDTKILAIARLEMDETKIRAQVRFVAVETTCQNRGYGKNIMQAVEQHAKQQGVDVIFLNARENALDFYLHLGYHLIEKGHLLFGEIQHYKMKKRLK